MNKIRRLTPKETKLAIETLAKIALMGDGTKSDIIDWISIGKNAKNLAAEAFAPKCPTCGKCL